MYQALKINKNIMLFSLSFYELCVVSIFFLELFVYDLEGTLVYEWNIFMSWTSTICFQFMYIMLVSIYVCICVCGFFKNQDFIF